jgi:ubiquinol oxidase
MKKFNEVTLNITVAIIDFLYRGRDYQRFWVLEEIARAPYFAFLSILHLRESLGLRGPEHLYLMKEHFAQTVNETEHLEYMESRGGNTYWVDPKSAYHLSYEVEIHAAETYDKFLENNEDNRIQEIMEDEIKHAIELREAMEMIK